MTAYNSQRVGAATVALGIAQGAYQLALDWSEKRHQFGRPINEFQGLQWKLADMSIKLSAAQALVYNAARSGEGGFPDMLLAAQAKVFTSENAIQVVNDALQFFGARGYSRELPLERMARDVRMFTIGGGTAQVLRNVVAGALLKKKLPQTRDGWVGDKDGHHKPAEDGPGPPKNEVGGLRRRGAAQPTRKDQTRGDKELKGGVARKSGEPLNKRQPGHRPGCGGNEQTKGRAPARARCACGRRPWKSPPSTQMY